MSNEMGINNLRDLGGKRTSENKTLKKGLFLRCAAPTVWNEQVKTQIVALKKPIIIDFRGVREEKNNPSRIPKDFLSKRVHLPIEPSVTDLLRELNEVDRSKKTEIEKIFQQAYRKYTIENIGTFEEFFNILFDNPDSTIMFHCTAGKDRTGFASALILSLFGIANETIIDDYLLSNETYKPTQKVKGEVQKIGIKQLLKVEESWLNAGLEEFSERVGNIRKFCTKIINGENRLREYLDYCQASGE
ncbi:tyrosine-protein phosphatase [Paracoccaceae bacterium]|nr:tyrosine-protein phosphatase [Paracoccaceae bacterium]